jgi:DNA segregation ATPase FtsK/SpoIIIE-like protein
MNIDLQRHLKIGFNRALGMMEAMEGEIHSQG